ncbi:MAG: hydrogenase formation protein HypD [bacterium]
MKNKRIIRIMEVCGTHTMAIARYGIKNLLPGHIQLISGPGCPVCVTAQEDLDKAIQIAQLPDVIMTTYGDMMRVPGNRTNLLSIKKQGADVRVVYSCLDALKTAQDNPQKKVVFMGVGFETTAPTIAETIREAKKQKINNFFVLANLKLLFPALDALADAPDLRVDGFICPGHVSVITGTAPYKKFAQKFKKPCVITGFLDTDIIKGIKRLIELIHAHKHTVEIEYTRAVKHAGNATARKLLSSVFSPSEASWRGLGVLKKSGLTFKPAYKHFDADKEFNIKISKKNPITGCICGDILRGVHTPQDCRLFKKRCTPQQPVGPCMVSSEGTCAAYFKYGH